jgi:2-furoyl-CoA dehydrogenase large subunit
MPNVKFADIQTPSPHSFNGAKGMGEGGAAPVHTLSAALQDALFDKGIIIDDSFNNGDRIFQLMQQAGKGRKPARVKPQAVPA